MVCKYCSEPIARLSDFKDVCSVCANDFVVRQIEISENTHRYMAWVHQKVKESANGNI